MSRLPKTLKNILKIIVLIFALWGFILTGVFFAMKLGLTNSKSLVDNQSQYFKDLFNNSKNSSKDQRESVANTEFTYIQNLEEWKVISLGIQKDIDTLTKVSKETGISERLIITPLISEQLRLMTSQREIFKRYFQPLALLGNQTQFSLGIYGIKEATAKQIEANLINPNSQYYLGKKYEHLLDYVDSNETLLVDAQTLEPVKSSSTTVANINQDGSTTTTQRDTILLTGNDAQRIKRLTNSNDRYYSYLYAAIYLKELENAWQKAGFDISDRPEILSTLYNIGFENSHPNADPKVGGAQIDLYGKEYSFGAISFYFYFSDALINNFPR